MFKTAIFATCLIIFLLNSTWLHAENIAGATSSDKNTRVRVAFSPEDNVAEQIIAIISHARKQVLVQAFSFTHDGIAQALIDAHRRGTEVKVIADREQTEKMDRGQVPQLAKAGVPVWLDAEHQSAHNKIIVVDGALVVTGSFNFTKAAQYRNAENVVFLDGNADLAETYSKNWRRHLSHSKPLLLH